MLTALKDERRKRYPAFVTTETKLPDLRSDMQALYNLETLPTLIIAWHARIGAVYAHNELTDENIGNWLGFVEHNGQEDLLVVLP